MVKTPLIIGYMLLAASCFGSTPGTYLIPSTEHGDNLPVWQKEYRRLWEKVLFVTPGELARFTKIGGLESEEKAVSVWKRSRGAKQEFWVTVTIAPDFIWPRLQQRRIDWSSIEKMRPKRCDLRIPESTALAVHYAWRKMLREVRRDPTRYVSLDNPTMLFSATDRGKTLHGELPKNAEGNPIKMIEIAQFLGVMCLAPSADLERDFRKVEKMAAKVYRGK
jgi:hypothetical protein